MKSKTFIINGDPIPLSRPRHGGRGKPYDPQKQLKLMTGITLLSQWNEVDKFEGPLHLDITFFMPIPASYAHKRRDALNKQSHTSKPDLSNLIKYIEDVATSILYSDDALITKITANKVYDFEPRTEFTVWELLHGK